MINADGYHKTRLKDGRKFYRAQTRIKGITRLSAKIFKRASDAMGYSDLLVVRYKRLKSAEVPTDKSA